MIAVINFIERNPSRCYSNWRVPQPRRGAAM
jgi:hypothetical protein